MLGATHVDAVRALRTAGDNLTVIVCDGFDGSQITEENQENILFNPALCDASRFSPVSQSSNTSAEMVRLNSYQPSALFHIEIRPFKFAPMYYKRTNGKHVDPLDVN